MSVPLVDRVERRFPFGFPLALMASGLVTRYDLLGLRADDHIPSAVIVFWLFALGWAAAKATSVWHRLCATVAILATIPGFFGEPWREAVIMGGLSLLVWVPSVPSVGTVNRAAGALAGSSLYIYLTHWQVFPRLDGYSALLALIASLAVGIGYALLAMRVMKLLSALRRRRSPQLSAGRCRGAGRCGSGG
jgi:hypothetical protein